MNTSNLVEVPGRRLGRLLTESRERAGLTLEDLVQSNSIGLSYIRLIDIEAGRYPMDAGLLESLLDLYGLDSTDLVPERTRLVIDLDEKMLITDTGSADIEQVDNTHHVLTSYLSLIYSLREIEPGAPVPLREVDLAVLAEALSQPTTEIERLLRAMMTPTNTEVVAQVGRIRSRRLLPVAGIVVGATAVGTIIAVGSTTDDLRSNPVDSPAMAAGNP
ncbi:MAG: helix-turn-helix domain-containing protein [Acidobacteria bacterium]|nr:helix-turn-helix domain-containing protein [Acidobacteriota bacterium]